MAQWHPAQTQCYPRPIRKCLHDPCMLSAQCYKQKPAPDEQMSGLARALLRDMVRDGQRVGIRLAAWVVPTSPEAAPALHLPPGLERHQLLLPVPAVPPPLLLRADHQQPPRLQHQHGIHRPGGLR